MPTAGWVTRRSLSSGSPAGETRWRVTRDFVRCAPVRREERTVRANELTLPVGRIGAISRISPRLISKNERENACAKKRICRADSI